MGLQLAVFASGSGSNFQSLVDHAESGALGADIRLCVSNKSSAGVLDRARAAGIRTLVLDPVGLDTDVYSHRLLSELESSDIDFIALAGYLRMVPSQVVREFRRRITNIHPALLPAFGGKGFYGIRVHRAVLEYGVKWTGVTIHLVDEQYDTGPIVLQEPVPVAPDDTPESLAARVLEVEHRLYPEALEYFARDRVTVDGRTVIIERSES